MGFLDNQVRFKFKTAEDGRHVYFPWGVFGRGYIVPSEADRQRIGKQEKIGLACQMVGSLAILLLTGAPLAILLLIHPYTIWQFSLYRHLERSEERLTIQEVTAKQARAMSYSIIWLLILLCFAFVFVGGLIFIYGVGQRDWQALLISILGIAFFGFCAIRGLKILDVK